MAQLKQTALFHDANLQGYWRTESNFTDESPNGYNLTAVNTPTFTTGKYGNGALFAKASSQYATIADASAPNLETTGDFSMGGWVKPTSHNTEQYLIGKVNSANSSFRVLFLTSSGTPRVIISGLTGGDLQADSNVVDGTLIFLGVVYDSGAGLLKIFTNTTKKQASVSGTPSSMSGVGFSVGRGGDFNGSYTDSLIDDSFFINRALSDAEMNNLASDPGTTTSTSTSTSTTTTSTSTTTTSTSTTTTSTSTTTTTSTSTTITTTSTSTTTTSTSTTTTSTSTSTTTSTSSTTSITTTSTTTSYPYHFEIDLELN